MSIPCDLYRYYEAQGILATHFTCPHHDECSKDSPCFTGPKAAYVGGRYEYAHDARLPRLLFVSLDSGSAERNPTNRLPEAVRAQTIALCLGPKTRHWYRTHELAACIFNTILGTCMTPRQAQQYFAHTNSAKCCQNRPSRGLAHRRLFTNCRPYLRGELKVLRPDVIVTQGDLAKIGVCAALDCPPVEIQGVNHVRIAGRTALWLPTYHPRAWGLFNRQRRSWATLAESIAAFVTTLRL